MTNEELKEICAVTCENINVKHLEGDEYDMPHHCADAIRAIKLPEEINLVSLKLFKQSLYVGMRFNCARYLMSNAYGRWDGAEKAQRHMELCQYIVASVMGCDPEIVRKKHENKYQLVHSATQVLTDNLDIEIGFPINSRPDYNDLEPKFFNRFFDLAIEALNVLALPSVSKINLPKAVVNECFTTADLQKQIENLRKKNSELLQLLADAATKMQAHQRAMSSIRVTEDDRYVLAKIETVLESDEK